jgi:hypothetical protein
MEVSIPYNVGLVLPDRGLSGMGLLRYFTALFHRGSALHRVLRRRTALFKHFNFIVNTARA